MPSLTPLSPDDIAELYGAIDDLIGTGNGIQTTFQATYFPLVGLRDVPDEFLGTGDGISANYQLHFFPIDGLTLELYPTSLNEDPLIPVTDYTFDAATGAVTLTVAGIAALGLEQLHAVYQASTTIELHRGTIGGTALTPGAHYTVTPRTGAFVLTAAGLAFLGTQQLHAAYQVARGMVNILTESNGSLRGSLITLDVQREVFNQKDSTFRTIHETIESLAILHVEAERRGLQNPTAIEILTAGNFVQVTEVVDELSIINSVTSPYRNNGLTNKYLYPINDPNSPDPAKPRKADGLYGGSGSDAANEENQINEELSVQASVQGNGADVPGNPGPAPARSGWYKRYDAALSTGMIADIEAQQTALQAQIDAIDDFLADNPSATDLVTSGNLTDATAAKVAAQAQQAANTAFLALIPYPSSGPYPGLSNANLAARAAQLATRLTEITTRAAQITTLLTTLYDARYNYIAMRSRLADGTKRKYVTTGLAIDQTNLQITDNQDRIDQIMTLIEAQ